MARCRLISHALFSILRITMKYTSITRSFRGYNYQTDWQTSDEWRMEMKRQEQADNEIEWSVLVFVHSGMPVLQYQRGREIILLENR